MTVPGPAPFERVTFLDKAIEDLKVVGARSKTMLTEVFRSLKLLDAGSLQPKPLHDFAKTGDLSDYAKIIAVLPDEPEHRIVIKAERGSFTVYEVIAAEARTDDLPYLLAGIRLGRVKDPVRRSDAGRRVYRIRKILDQ